MTKSKLRKFFYMGKVFGFKYLFTVLKEQVNQKLNHLVRFYLHTQYKPHGIVVRDILGIKLILNPDKAGLNKDLLLDNIREPLSTSKIFSEIKKTDVVLDVGANIGYYALLESRQAKKVIAVEPELDNYRQLLNNIELNNLKNVETFNMAFGDKNDSVKMMYLSSRPNQHTFYKKDYRTRDYAYVKMMTVDSFLEENNLKPSVIRMDIQGYEVFLFKGMKDSLKSFRMIFIELHTDRMTLEETQQILDMIKDYGFKLSFLARPDFCGVARELPVSYLGRIYKGDFGNYKMIFKKDEDNIK